MKVFFRYISCDWKAPHGENSIKYCIAYPYCKTYIIVIITTISRMISARIILDPRLYAHEHKNSQKLAIFTSRRMLIMVTAHVAHAWNNHSHWTPRMRLKIRGNKSEDSNQLYLEYMVLVTWGYSLDTGCTINSLNETDSQLSFVVTNFWAAHAKEPNLLENLVWIVCIKYRSK